MNHATKYQGFELLAFTLGAILASGCSGKSVDAPACDAPAPCGGDLVGVWQVSDSCARADVPLGRSQSCPGATGTISDINVTGTIEFRADGSTLTTGSEEVVSRLSFPETCLHGTMCADWSAVLSDGPDAGAGNSHQATCTAGAQSCDCTMSMKQTAGGLDTYTASGTQVTTTSGSSGHVTTQSYCVQGTSLTMWDDKLLVHATRVK